MWEALPRLVARGYAPCRDCGPWDAHNAALTSWKPEVYWWARDRVTAIVAAPETQRSREEDTRRSVPKLEPLLPGPATKADPTPVASRPPISAVPAGSGPSGTCTMSSPNRPAEPSASGTPRTARPSARQPVLDDRQLFEAALGPQAIVEAEMRRLQQAGIHNEWAFRRRMWQEGKGEEEIQAALHEFRLYDLDFSRPVAASRGEGLPSETTPPPTAPSLPSSQRPFNPSLADDEPSERSIREHVLKAMNRLRPVRAQARPPAPVPPAQGEASAHSQEVPEDLPLPNPAVIDDDRTSDEDPEAGAPHEPAPDDPPNWGTVRPIAETISDGRRDRERSEAGGVESRQEAGASLPPSVTSAEQRNQAGPDPIRPLPDWQDSYQCQRLREWYDRGYVQIDPRNGRRVFHGTVEQLQRFSQALTDEGIYVAHVQRVLSTSLHDFVRIPLTHEQVTEMLRGLRVITLLYRAARGTPMKGALGSYRFYYHNRLTEEFSAETVVDRAVEVVAAGGKVVILTRYKSGALKDPYAMVEAWAGRNFRHPDLGRKARWLSKLAEQLKGQTAFNLPPMLERLGGLLAEHGIRTATLHGGLADEVKNQGLRDFQRGDTPVLLATMDSARGLNLHDTAGNRPRTLIALDLPWTRSEADRMVGCVVRLGARSQAHIVWLFANTPVAEEMAHWVMAKMIVQGYAVHGEIPPDIEAKIRRMGWFDFLHGDMAELRFVGDMSQLVPTPGPVRPASPPREAEAVDDPPLPPPPPGQKWDLSDEELAKFLQDHPVPFHVVMWREPEAPGWLEESHPGDDEFLVAQRLAQMREFRELVERDEQEPDLVAQPEGEPRGDTIRESFRGPVPPPAPGEPTPPEPATPLVRSPSFVRVGPSDLAYDLPLTREEASRGTGKIVRFERGHEVETVRVVVPAGVRPEARLRLKGKGYLDESGAHGDVYLRVTVRD